MIEQDVIGHLIDVERLAYDLLLDAQQEADKRKAIAKEQAETEFRSAYEQIVAALETQFLADKQACEDEREQEYSQYAQQLLSINRDTANFNAFLETYFSGKQ